MMWHLNRSNIDEGLVSSERNPLPNGQQTLTNRRISYLVITILTAIAIVLPVLEKTRAHSQHDEGNRQKLRNFDAQINTNANELLRQGRQIFRFDTFGDEAFWGDTLQLHKAIEGANLGGSDPASVQMWR